MTTEQLIDLYQWPKYFEAAAKESLAEILPEGTFIISQREGRIQDSDIPTDVPVVEIQFVTDGQDNTASHISGTKASYIHKRGSMLLQLTVPRNGNFDFSELEAMCRLALDPQMNPYADLTQYTATYLATQENPATTDETDDIASMRFPINFKLNFN